MSLHDIHFVLIYSGCMGVIFGDRAGWLSALLLLTVFPSAVPSLSSWFGW